jgi:uncharacterized membrane protein
MTFAGLVKYKNFQSLIILLLLLFLSYNILFTNSIISQTSGGDSLGNPNTSQTIRAGDDVGIEYIWDVDRNITGVLHYPGFQVNLNVTIMNFGDSAISTAFDILLNITDDGFPQYIYESKKTLPAALGLSVLLPKTSYNLSWNWTPPKPEQMPPGSKNDYTKNDVTFKARIKTMHPGDIDTSNDRKGLEIVVSKPDFMVKLSRGWWWQNGSNLEYEGYEKTVLTIKKNKLNQFDLKFTLENVGEATGISFEMINPYDWTAILPATQFWLSGMNSSDPARNLSVTVLPSSDLKNLPHGFDIKITLKAICDSYPDIYTTLNFIVNINYIPNPIIIPPEPTDDIGLFRFQPGFEYLDFKFINMGNGKDNFQIDASVGLVPDQTEGLMASGWNAVVHTGKYTKVLARGEHQNITLKLRIPSTVAVDSTCPVILSATSIKDPIHEDSEVNVTFLIQVDQFRSISIVDPIPETISMYPNSEEKVTIYIENTGNSVDKSISLNVSEKPNEFWEIFLDTSDIPPSGLERSGTAFIDIIIKTPKNVLENEYFFNITANSDNIITDEISISVRVLEVYKFSLTSDIRKQFGNFTEELDFFVVLNNLGNTDDSIFIEHSLETPGMENLDWKVNISKNIVQLNYNESKIVKVSIYIPPNAVADTDFNTPYADGYRVKVIGTSMNDSWVTMEREFEIVVNPVYNFELDKEKKSVNLILNNEKTSVDFSFKITNTGNDIDWYDITYESDFNWLTISFSQRRLIPGATEELFINFESPWTRDAGSYEFLIICTSNKDTTLVRKLELIVNIEIFDLKLVEFRLGDLAVSEAELTEGDVVLLRAKLENNGDLNYSYDDFGRELVIGFYEGSNYIDEANFTFLPSKEYSINNTIWVAVEWKVSKSRLYKLRVKIDPNNDLPDSNKNNNEIISDLYVKPEHSSSEGGEQGFLNFIFIPILILVIFLIIIIAWIMIAKRRKRANVKSKLGEYKPSTGASEKKVEFESDYDKGFEEEPDGGILDKPGERSKLKEEREQFLAERLELVEMKPVSSMKPVKMMKPIPTSKPIIDEKKKQNNE